MLGDDTTALKFLGFDDEQSEFMPGPQLSAVPHTMGGDDKPYSYESRVTALLDNGVFPVPIQGFVGGTKCDVDNSLTCASNDCPDMETGCTAAPTEPPTAAPTALPTVAGDMSTPTSLAIRRETRVIMPVTTMTLLALAASFL